ADPVDRIVHRAHAPPARHHLDPVRGVACDRPSDLCLLRPVAQPPGPPVKDRMSNLWKRKPLEQLLHAEVVSAEHPHELKKTLGPGSLVALGIGAIIGAGLFVKTASAAAYNAGPAVTIGFIVAAIGCAFAGLCYAEFASMIPIAGSAYTYAYATLGE